MSGAVYLDYNASTPIDPRVLERMLPFLRSAGGNASSTHAAGRRAREAVEVARNAVAMLIGADESDIVFTSGATEANNLAILGMHAAGLWAHALTSATEHKAVLAPLDSATQRGGKLTTLRPLRHGALDDDDMAKAPADVDLLCAMLANNEVGTVSPVRALGEWARARDARFHVDATQGVGHVPFTVDDAAVTTCALSAHKIYGPTGVGALFARRAIRGRMTPLVSGGGQEAGLRAGTLNVAAIVGFGAACTLMREQGGEEAQRLASFRDTLWAALHEKIPLLESNAASPSRLPGTLNVFVPHAPARAVIARLHDVVDLSAGSACTQASVEPSHVLRAMGWGNDRAQCSLRMSVGRPTTPADIAAAASAIAAAVDSVRRENPVWAMLNPS